MIRDKYIAIRCTKNEYEAINEMANIKGCRVSELIRESLNKLMELESWV